MHSSDTAKHLKPYQKHIQPVGTYGCVSYVVFISEFSQLRPFDLAGNLSCCCCHVVYKNVSPCCAMAILHAMSCKRSLVPYGCSLDYPHFRTALFLKASCFLYSELGICLIAILYNIIKVSQPHGKFCDRDGHDQHFILQFKLFWLEI